MDSNVEPCVQSRPGSGAEVQTKDAPNIQCPPRGLVDTGTPSWAWGLGHRLPFLAHGP